MGTDLVGIGTKEQSQTLELMRIVEELGLPVGGINQPAGYFSMKQRPFENHLLRLHKGKSAEILRPDLYLYMTLKIGRLSESDLTDCLAMLKREPALKREDSEKIRKLIRSELKKTEQVSKPGRLTELLEELG